MLIQYRAGGVYTSETLTRGDVPLKTGEMLPKQHSAKQSCYRSSVSLWPRSRRGSSFFQIRMFLPSWLCSNFSQYRPTTSRYLPMKQQRHGTRPASQFSSLPLKCLSFLPRTGRVSFFSSGSENLHRVERVTWGTRYAITVSFTCDPAHAIADPTLLGGTDG